ncbi:hypothetical protein HDV00_007037 [Rhizophlyctis rosea]|nr:hypothetical protein HDV00_007037 [Rhizophlyctis rosea]
MSQTIARGGSPQVGPDFGADEAYRYFHTFVGQGESMLNQVIAYFHERKKIEQAYHTALEKLVVPIAPYASSGNKSLTVSRAWMGINQITHSLAVEHAKLADVMDGILAGLIPAKKTQSETLQNLRSAVRREQKDYYELKQATVPKLKSTYFKRSKELQNADKDKDDGPPSQKNMKLQKDMAGAEQAYRKGIQELEEARYRLLLMRDRAFQVCQHTERDRINITKSSFLKYREAEANLSKVRTEVTGNIKPFVDGINPDIDLSVVAAEFQVIWAQHLPVPYENYVHGLAKDMVFGVPLDVTLRDRAGEAIPAAFYKCIKAIEARGLDKEGIYRVSGKHTDVVELKQQLEKDVNQVDLLDDRWDLHVIAALVKLYLRTLPIPLFPFQPKDRAEHSHIQSEQERILRLRTRIKSLTRSHQNVLKFLVEHLALVTSHSAKNKMTVQNIALIFSSFIFQPPPETETAPEKALPFWKNKEQEPKQDLSQFEFMKQDGVLEDLINHHERIFATEPPRPVMQEPSHPNSTPIPLRVDSLPDRVRTLGRPPSSPSPVPIDNSGKHLSAGMVGMLSGSAEPPRSPRPLSGRETPKTPPSPVLGGVSVPISSKGETSSVPAGMIKAVPPLAVVNPDVQDVPSLAVVNPDVLKEGEDGKPVPKETDPVPGSQPAADGTKKDQSEGADGGQNVCEELMGENTGKQNTIAQAAGKVATTTSNEPPSAAAVTVPPAPSTSDPPPPY